MATSDCHRSVAAVVVTWNRKRMLQKCLDCLLRQEGASCDILVIDNDSTDGTGAFVAAEYALPQVHYFNTGENFGGAGGFHLGLYWAVISGYEYVWLMDDDALPEPTALVELLQAGSMLGDWGFLSSAVYWTDGSLCLANRPKKNLYRHIGNNDLNDGPVSVRMGSFVSMLVRASVVQEIGLPIAEYFIWTDDYEFSGRISKLHPCYFVPASKVTHSMASNTRADLVTTGGDRAARFRKLFRNDVNCYRQHGIEGWAYLVAKCGYTAADVLLRAESARGARLCALLKGYCEGLQFNPTVVYVDDCKTRVLIYTDGWGCGGIESFVMGVLRNIDMGAFDISLFSPWDAGDDWLSDELEELGVRRYTLQRGKRPSNVKRGVLDLVPFVHKFDLSRFDVFHANTTTVVGLAYCREAKRHGAKRVIAHSHSSSYGAAAAAMKAVLHAIGRSDFNRFVDVRLACSVDAGEYLFGNRSFEVVKNCIDTERFRFDAKTRERARAALGIDASCFLVGNVGRLADEKDPLFQLRVFAELLRLNCDAKYLMVGGGPLEGEIEALISELCLGDVVIRMSATCKPEECYCALDAFLFPSVFEGLSVSAIEAQCSGLPVLASSHLPQEIKITDLLHWESKDAPPAKWAQDLVEMRVGVSDRIAYADVVAKAGFSPSAITKRIAELYVGDELRA